MIIGNAQVFTDGAFKQGSVTVENGVITAIGNEASFDVDAGGNVNAGGDINGDVSASDDVRVGGDVNGDIRGKTVTVECDYNG